MKRGGLLLCFVFFFVLQVTVGVTTVAEEKRGRSQFRPAAFPAARWNTRRQLFLPPIPVQKGSLAISGVLRTVL